MRGASIWVIGWLSLKDQLTVVTVAPQMMRGLLLLVRNSPGNSKREIWRKSKKSLRIGAALFDPLNFLCFPCFLLPLPSCFLFWVESVLSLTILVDRYHFIYRPSIKVHGLPLPSYFFRPQLSEKEDEKRQPQSDNTWTTQPGATERESELRARIIDANCDSGFWKGVWKTYTPDSRVSRIPRKPVALETLNSIKNKKFVRVSKAVKKWAWIKNEEQF